MIIKKPIFWDKKKPNLLSTILLPFTIPLIINNILSNFNILIIIITNKIILVNSYPRPDKFPRYSMASTHLQKI